MVPADRFVFPTGQTGLYGRRRNFRLSAAAKDAAEKSENAVIPSAARDPSWFKCPQKEGFLVASLLGMTAILTFSATSKVQLPLLKQGATSDGSKWCSSTS